MTATADGFKIGEEDLKLRGPGELLGTAQSGEVWALSREHGIIPSWLPAPVERALASLGPRTVQTDTNSLVVETDASGRDALRAALAAAGFEINDNDVATLGESGALHAAIEHSGVDLLGRPPQTLIFGIRRDRP